MAGTVSALSQLSPEDDWFRLLAEGSSAAVVVYREHRLLYANSAAAELTGYPVEDLLAMEDVQRLVTSPFRQAAVARALV